MVSIPSGGRRLVAHLHRHTAAVAVGTAGSSLNACAGGGIAAGDGQCLAILSLTSLHVS